MSRPRDQQRQRVYRAENGVDRGRRLDSVADIQAYVDGLLRSRWFRARWGVWGRIEVRDGRGRRSAAAFGQHQIRVPVWARSELVVLHEVAHCLAPVRAAAHGPEFAAVHLALVRQFMGPAVAVALRSSYRAHHVRIGAAPAPRPRQIGAA